MATTLTMITCPSKAKRDFGSFFASNVDELVHLSEAEYEAPEWPVTVPDVSAAATVEFGAEMRRKYFYLDPSWAFLNHGAFGSALRPAQEFAQALQIHCERQPLRFLDRESMPLEVRVLRRLAKFVGSKPTNLVLVENATVGSNSAIQSMNLTRGDVVCCFNITYGAVKKQIFHWCKSAGATVNEVKITFPIASDDELLSKFEEALSVPGTKFAVIDHIPSGAPLVMPVQRMVAMCRERDIRILIDGAHALGTLDLALDALGADYYVANAHKWLCAPKTCALLYCRPEQQASLHSVVVSHGYEHGMAGEFLFPGTRDFSGILALESVLDFWETVGVDRIRSYITERAVYYRKYLTELWCSDYMVPEHMVAPITNVRLPRDLYKDCDPVSYAHCEFIQNELYQKYKVEAVMKAIDGHMYVRLSWHIYNTHDEIERLVDAVLDLTKQNVLSRCKEMVCHQ